MKEIQNGRQNEVENRVDMWLYCHEGLFDTWKSAKQLYDAFFGKYEIWIHKKYTIFYFKSKKQINITK